MSIQEQENLYLIAKTKYYEGEPILSDFEFDLLEEELKAQNSQVIKIVGSQELKDIKFNHASPMLSLNKIQVQRNEAISIPSNKFLGWQTSNSPNAFQKYTFEATPKFDGSSCNLIYENGKLTLALTRGDGTKGQNIIEKMKLIVPQTISIQDKVEIRGEVVIPVSTFESKYSEIYKNPRNFVAGILGRDIVDNQIVSDFHFISFECRIHEDGEHKHHSKTFEFLNQNGFRTTPKMVMFDNFEYAYTEILNYRTNGSPYQLDGMVIKFPEANRNEIGETEFAPKWAVAIKFPPKESITTIKELVWNVGLSSEFTPVAILDPIDLDGTTVSNVNLHNYGNVLKQGLLPGAKVIIVKSGDIIPIVQKVLEPSTESIEKYLPKPCSSDCKIEIQGQIHLVCTNPNCPNKSILQLCRGIGSFGFRNVAGSTIKKLHKAGITTIHDVFDNSKFNETELIKSGQFKKGRQLEILMNSRNNPERKITLPLVITSLAFDNVGWSTATQIAKLFEDKIPNWTGLSSASYAPFLNKNSNEYQSVLSLIDILNSNGFEIQTDEPVQISADSIKYEMTGSPKPYGFKTKEDFVNLIKAHGYAHTGLDKTTHILITDDINSSSSKMAKAKKLGVEIKTYEEILKSIK
jgi:DNA ligase (NAD+)